MTDAVQIELIRSIPMALAAASATAAAYFSYLGSGHAKKAAEVSQKAADNSNGLSEKLVKLTDIAARAQGNLEGRAELKEENRGDG